MALFDARFGTHADDGFSDASVSSDSGSSDPLTREQRNRILGEPLHGTSEGLTGEDDTADPMGTLTSKLTRLATPIPKKIKRRRSPGAATLTSELDQEELQRWKHSLGECINTDAFGQREEACRLYASLVDDMLGSLKGQNVTADDVLEDPAGTVTGLLLIRAHCLEHSANASPSLKEMRTVHHELLSVLSGLCESSVSIPPQPPIDLSDVLEVLFTTGHIEILPDTASPGHAMSPGSNVDADRSLEATTPEHANRTAEQHQPRSSGGKLSIVIQRIGFKDFLSYFDPHISVVVCDREGKVLEQQHTPVTCGQEPAEKREHGGYLVFNHRIDLQLTLENIEQGDCGLFFEFKHFKPHKRKVSCRAWALMEKDELKSGSVALELYKKPSDYRRRASKFTLFSSKPLYLHLHLIVC